MGICTWLYTDNIGKETWYKTSALNTSKQLFFFQIASSKSNMEIRDKQAVKSSENTHTLFAQKSPHALQSDLGPDGPRLIIGVDFELMPQCVHLERKEMSKTMNFEAKFFLRIKSSKSELEWWI